MVTLRGVCDGARRGGGGPGAARRKEDPGNAAPRDAWREQGRLGLIDDARVDCATIKLRVYIHLLFFFFTLKYEVYC